MNPIFQNNILAVCFDEAHTILEWGGSFRPVYREAGGILRGRLPGGVPFMAASATMAPRLIEDLCQTLGIRDSARRIEFSNARPNIALVVRKMTLPENSFADLLFLIGPGITTLTEIDTTLVYFNERMESELANDFIIRHLPPSIPESAVAFYHRDVGEKRKQDIILGMRMGTIQIVMATEACLSQGWKAGALSTHEIFLSPTNLLGACLHSARRRFSDTSPFICLYKGTGFESSMGDSF
jgi:superfamily II DNA helicase RecQ